MKKDDKLDRECLVCFEQVPHQFVTFQPCGHRQVCGGCAGAVMHGPKGKRECPKCRQPATGYTP